MPAMSDESIIVKNQGTIFLGGPLWSRPPPARSVPRTWAAAMRTRACRVADHLAENDLHALALATPGGGKPEQGQAPVADRPASLRRRGSSGEELYGVIPVDTRKLFDVREIIARMRDGSQF